MSDVLFVSDVPVSGANQQFLYSLIAYWNLKPKEWSIATLVKKASIDKNGKKKAITTLEQDTDRPDFIQTVKTANPKLIIALGSPPSTELCTLTGSHIESTGKVFTSKDVYGKKPVLVFQHPNYFVRAGKNVTDLTKPSSADRSIMRGLQFVSQYLGKERLLVLDIETDASTDVTTAKVRFVGYYSDVTKEMKMTADLREVQHMIDAHTHIIGFNNREFDHAILERYGLKFNNKVTVDLYKALTARGRAGVMGLDKLPSNSLETVLEHLKIGKKLTFDYDLLIPDPPYSDETIEKLKEYLFADIEGTWKLYQWWTEWATPYRHFVSEQNQWKKTYMTCSVASFAYKAICHAAGLPEDYNDSEDDYLVKTQDIQDILKHLTTNTILSPESIDAITKFAKNKTKRLKVEDEDNNLFSITKKDDFMYLVGEFEGGFVAIDEENAKGNVVLMDFKSLYPSVELQGNLFSPVTPDYTGPVFEKNSFYPDLPGRFKADKPGLIETTVMNIWRERQEFKKRKDTREYAHKITMNSLYGASTCKNFKSVYNEFIGPCTTYMGRTNIKFARQEFKNHGFKVIYSDTDSCFIQIPEGKTMEDVNKIRLHITEEIQKNVPFPFPEFELAVESKIKYFQGFRGKTGQLLKKFYLYIKENDDIITKGIPIVKSDCTTLSKNVYEKKIRPAILYNLNCFFTEQEIMAFIKEAYEADHTVAAKLFKVKSVDKYALPSQLNAQIAARYGAGNVWLVKNLRMGIGGGVRYCSIEEAKKLQFEDIDFSSSINELSYFMINRDEVLKRSKKKEFIPIEQKRLSEFF